MHQAVSTLRPRLDGEAAPFRRKKTNHLRIDRLIASGSSHRSSGASARKPIPSQPRQLFVKTILQTVSATGKVQPETEVKIFAGSGR